MPNVRAASEADLPGILAIYNDVIATSTAVYTSEPRHARGAARVVLRAWPGYRYTVEHSVHVRGDMRGRGVGRLLIEALFPAALALGKHVMIGGIDAANEASIRFHARLGFERVASFREVGHKFGRWLDLIFMQRFLDPPGSWRA
jgi:L-amino acid N-acyltransferase